METAPESAQVFVDGYYVGLAGDYGARGHMLDLAAGSHRIEMRAAGFSTVTFDINISPNEVVRYRGDLQALPPSTPPMTVLPIRTTVYVIPNCYAGDRPPTGPLRPGCDLAAMRIRR